MNNPILLNAAALIGRLLLVVMFILSGYGKIGGYAGTQQYMASAGVPGALLPLVILLELLGSLLVAIGYQTRIAALALAGFTLLAGLLFHFNLADGVQSLLFWKNITIVGGFLLLFANGPGAWSVDQRKDA